MFFFLGYVLAVELHIFTLPQEYLSEFLVRSFTLVQLGLLAWTTSGLLKQPRITRNILLVFSLASVFLASANLLRIPGFYQTLEGGRVTAIGDNPNEVGGNMALSIVMLTGLAVYGSYRHSFARLMLASLTVPPLLVMVSTGSRGMVIAFMAGCLVYLSPFCHSKRFVLSVALSILLVLGLVSGIVYNPHFIERWQETYSTGSMAGREEIFPAALAMFMERPIAGWGPVRWYYELGRRLSVPTGRDAHNLWLALLIEVGLVGTIPFFAGFFLCGRSAWKARSGDLGLVPLAVLITLLVGGLSATTVVSKTQWLILAATAAAERYAPRMRREWRLPDYGTNA
jgi:O-antigen ligase